MTEELGELPTPFYQHPSLILDKKIPELYDNKKNSVWWINVQVVARGDRTHFYQFQYSPLVPPSRAKHALTLLPRDSASCFILSHSLKISQSWWRLRTSPSSMPRPSASTPRPSSATPRPSPWMPHPQQGCHIPQLLFLYPVSPAATELLVST